MNDIEKKVAKENRQSQGSADNYEFVTETIKKRPINVKRIVKKILMTIVLAVIFGVVSSVTLIFLYPKLQMRIYPKDDTRTVTLPVAQDEPEADIVEEFVMPKEDSAVADVSEKTQKDVKTQIEDTQSIDSVEAEDTQTKTGDNDADSKDDQEVVINQVVETVEKSLELEDYKALLMKVSSIAETAQKSLVTVSGKSSNMDWFNNSYVDNNSATGLIVADNGKDLLIVSPTYILHRATFVDVTFCDGMTYSANVRRSDANTGLSIVAVNLNKISDDTMEKIELAQFGSLSTSAVGMPVIAIGTPYGTAGSVAMGQITSNSTIIDKADASLRIISTDIYGSSSATGVLVNYNGRIVGVMCHEDMFSDMPNLIRAYAITDITDNIEKISNGQDIASLGIIGTDVTQEAQEEYGVPKGTYVKEVVSDSIAMEMGIRNGDVITKIGTEDIKSFDDYKKVLLGYQPGDIVNVTLQRPGSEEYIEIIYEVTLEAQK